MELSEKIRDCIGTVEEWADEAAALKRENDEMRKRHEWMRCVISRELPGIDIAYNFTALLTTEEDTPYGLIDWRKPVEGD